MNSEEEYKQFIIKHTLGFEEVQDNNIWQFNWLKESIYEGKRPLKINTVDFIIFKILTNDLRVYKFYRKKEFDVFVFGSFRKFFNPTTKVADALADFYLEFQILPNIISVPKHILLKHKKEFANKIRNGVRVYERR